ncbi:hypothetical protein DRW41_11890 [Neobacillus piezotolerans]|uniref:Bacterial Pleckstrin homology domain-containing protein n=1 Tax=Neobacillus piezotolerans TaxID=2259171 RepID=A0A3D8GQZ6_9BACI|nr:DUF3784 domain-containing protein [Neobacillus piezotolerans]RDU36747.1 hypothetical protein DRW41_11890 [Neobacillus piezotolerans]
MLALFFILMGTALLLLLLGWAVSKGGYWLISGFAFRPKEEQEKLIEAGFPQKVGKLLMATAAGMVLLLPLLFTSFPYAVEVIIGFMLIFLLGGIIYLSRYEVPEKRKKSYIISSGIALITFVSLGVLMFFGYQETELIFKKEGIEITGMYGEEIPYGDIQNVKLLEEMPKATVKIDGFGTSLIAKGKFKLDGYGPSLLFIQKGKPPYLQIKTKDRHIFINSPDPDITRSWVEKLK